jgi:hypothetical protein
VVTTLTFGGIKSFQSASVMANGLLVEGLGSWLNRDSHRHPAPGVMSESSSRGGSQEQAEHQPGNLLEFSGSGDEPDTQSEQKHEYETAFLRRHRAGVEEDGQEHQ